jgi:hypothetical protein
MGIPKSWNQFPEKWNTQYMRSKNLINTAGYPIMDMIKSVAGVGEIRHPPFVCPEFWKDRRNYRTQSAAVRHPKIIKQCHNYMLRNSSHNWPAYCYL